MKKNTLGLSVVIFTIMLSSFTSTKFNNVYLVFDSTGAENAFSNYSQQITSPGTDPYDAHLWWFSVHDVNSQVTQFEFPGYFAARDTNNDNMLSDEDEIPGVLEKRGEI